MAKSDMYDIDKTAPVVIVDEDYTDCGATAFSLGTIPRLIGGLNMVVRTAAAGGGDLLVQDVDYELINEDFYYTEEVETGVHIYRKVRIITVGYQTGTLYFSYDCYGTYTSIASIQALLNLMAAAIPKASPVRQTVSAGAVSAAGDPNFLSIGAGLAVNMAATSTPVRMSFAHGFGDNGAVDYIEKFVEDDIFSSLTPFANPFLYGERTGAGIVGLGHGVYSPQYSKAFVGADSDAILAHFEGAGAFTDSYNNAATFGENAALSGTQKKFGGASVRHNNATNGYVEFSPIRFSGKWTIEWWLYMDGVAANQILLSCPENYMLQVSMLTATKKLYLYLGNGASWSIANAQIGSTVLSATTWYRVVLQYDGANYKLWLDDGATVNLEANVASVSSIQQPSRLRLGAAATSIVGYSDELRVSPYARYTTPTVQSAVWAEEEMYWFSLSEYIGYKGYPGAWTACDRVYLGECVTDGTAVLSVIKYALNGKYESAVFDAVENTSYPLSHNIGTSKINVMVLAREAQGYNWTPVVASLMVSTAAASQRAHGGVAWNRNTLKFLAASVDLLEIDVVQDDDLGAAFVENVAQVLIHAERIF